MYFYLQIIITAKLMQDKLTQIKAVLGYSGSSFQNRQN